MKIIIIILQAILNLVRKRRDLIANRNKIPPEYRDDVVVWYSPKKQKLTNYDVIESYTEDFTKWTKNGNVTSAVTVNNNSIVINGSIKSASIFKKSNTFIQSINIIVSGIKKGDNVDYRCVKNGALRYITVVNGINKLPASELTENPDFNIGFVLNINSTGIINLKQIPTSILKDFSGNGHDAYMYGFQGKLNSGIGIYNNDFTDSGYVNGTWVYNRRDITVNGADSFTVHNNYENWVFRCTTNVKSMTVKIVGVSDDVNFKYRYESANGDKYIYFKKDGVYELPATIGTWQGFNLEKNNDVDVNITVTQIPDYPNSLCYAGKQYCQAYNLPKFTDYTIITRRAILSLNNSFAFISKRIIPANTGAFILEKDNNVIGAEPNTLRAFTFGVSTPVNPNLDYSITYQTKTKYKEQDITVGDAGDSNVLLIGAGLYNENINGVEEFITAAHDDIIIFKRSLTINEINDITKAIFNETIIEE